MQLTINSFRQLFPDKISPWHFPDFLVKSLTFPGQLSNSLTFPGFQTSGHADYSSQYIAHKSLRRMMNSAHRRMVGRQTVL